MGLGTGESRRNSIDTEASCHAGRCYRCRAMDEIKWIIGDVVGLCRTVGRATVYENTLGNMNSMIVAVFQGCRRIDSTC